MKSDVTARIISSILVVVAYWVTMYYNLKCGAIIYLIANSLALPYMIKQKCWDVVALLTFLIIIGLPKIIL
ncbi:hypothetical protein EB001_05135 [bacterium]|nr:hypothetical protein [bacterium]